jgi:hypothetical protein
MISLAVAVASCHTLSCNPLSASHGNNAMHLLKSGYAISSFASAKRPKSSIALVQANLSQAASRALQNELPSMMCRQVFRQVCQKVESEARRKLPTYGLAKPYNTLGEILLDPGIRSKAKTFNRFVAPVASVPPETLDLLFLSVDFCIVNPRPCKSAVEKQAAMYAIKVAKQSRETYAYRNDCGFDYTSGQSNQLRLRSLSSNTKDACKIIDLLSRVR